MLFVHGFWLLVFLIFLAVVTSDISKISVEAATPFFRGTDSRNVFVSTNSRTKSVHGTSSSTVKSTINKTEFGLSSTLFSAQQSLLFRRLIFFPICVGVGFSAAAQL